MTGNAVELAGIVRRFGAHEVLRGVSLEVAERSLTAVLGPSGSGKTTLLRAIAGFERLDGGVVRIGGEVVDDGRTRVRPEHRRVGYVPQEGALFPHLRVAANIGFGLRGAGLGRAAARARVAGLLDLVDLAGLERRFPHQLSGGQQQRVALARALAVRPRVVLLDEPFSSLDASLRATIREQVARILADAGATSILVTHDQDEALSLADRVAVLQDGRIVALGAPREVYRRPADLATARFLGDVNVLDARRAGAGVRTVLGIVPLAEPGCGPDGGTPLRVLVRPEQVEVHSGTREGACRAVVEQTTYFGHDMLARLRVPDGSSVLARVSGRTDLVEGDAMWLTVAGAAVALPSPDAASAQTPAP